jgi:hypothetical protein
MTATLSFADMSRIALDDLRSAAAEQDKNLNAALSRAGFRGQPCAR